MIFLLIAIAGVVVTLIISKKIEEDKKRDAAICVNCNHVGLRTVPPRPGMVWVYNEVCLAVPKGTDYVTGGQSKSIHLCHSENPNGKCRRFQPKGDEE